MSGKKTIEEEVVELLLEKGYTITCAESCTGGLLCASLVNVSGASEVLNRSVVTYANEAKQSLAGVKAETLEAYGAVSEQTAREMAEGGAKAANASAALAVTGIAGPDGGSKEKLVGLVYIGCCVNGTTVVERNVFSGSRREVREQSVAAALKLLKKQLQ
jgi:PncC family amidohydrolase